jgi:hypothetical protein
MVGEIQRCKAQTGHEAAWMIGTKQGWYRFFEKLIPVVEGGHNGIGLLLFVGHIATYVGRQRSRAICAVEGIFSGGL